MKNHFFISYFGNKRSECETIYESIKDKLDDIEYIVEPFCGSSAFSYFLSLKHPKKFKYILNDNNKHLIECYRIFSDEPKLFKFIKTLNEFCENIDKEKYLKIINIDDSPNWFLKHKLYKIRPGLFPNDYESRKKIDFESLIKIPIVNFLRSEHITFLSCDGIDTFNSYHNNDRALIFLDPPYFQIDNSMYLDSNINIYEYLTKNNISDMKSKIILVVEDNWVIRYVFNKFIIKEYSKVYNNHKHKKTTHLIIYNEDQ